VTGAADDDPSGIGTYAQVGAALGQIGRSSTRLATRSSSLGSALPAVRQSSCQRARACCNDSVCGPNPPAG
jgi:hypothetical protein